MYSLYKLFYSLVCLITLHYSSVYYFSVFACVVQVITIVLLFLYFAFCSANNHNLLETDLVTKQVI